MASNNSFFELDPREIIVKLLELIAILRRNEDRIAVDIRRKIVGHELFIWHLLESHSSL